MSNYIIAEVTVTCNSLGYDDGVKYHIYPDCFESIKDLIKYLRKDSSDHIIRRYLGRSKVLQTDLIKICIQHANDNELWDVLLRLLINLTSPVSMLFNDALPIDKNEDGSKNMYTIYLEIASYLEEYKIALANEDIWTVVCERLSKILSIDPMERGEANDLTLERILTLIRNTLEIPTNEREKRVDNDSTAHDMVLYALHSSGTLDILLFIVSNMKEQQYHIQILEIVSLMLREQNVVSLASVGKERSNVEKEKDEARLINIRKKELQEKMDKMKKYSSSRHSRFGGTYVVENMKAIGDNPFICHKPYNSIGALEFGKDKVKIKRPKNKVAVAADLNEERNAALAVRLILKEFCVEFLNGAYNPVMRYTRSFIIGGSSEAIADASYYLWALRFFMEFNRHYKFQVKLVSETISTEIFHLVQRQMEHTHEMMLIDKKKIPYWAVRLHLGLKAYKELLHTLLMMDKSEDVGVKESSKVIKSNIFYVPEYRETLLSQMLGFNETKMTQSYLVDLVATVHLFLKMLEHFCSKQRGLVVQKIKRKRQKKKSKKAKESSVPSPTLEDRWDDAGPELSAVMLQSNIPEVIPFDATLPISINEQKSDAMKRIQKLLRGRDFEQAVGLFRSARKVWPENDCFGRENMPVEEEFLAMREIFFADLGVVEEPEAANKRKDEKHSTSASEDNEDEDEEKDTEEEEEGKVVVEETNFNFNEFLHRFANVKVVKAVSILLKKFNTNSAEVNHYVAKMLHRVAWDCKMPAMIFQASIFRSFQKILESKNPEHNELKKFSIFIIRRFAEIAQKNRKMYMELLFWKTTRDATEIVEGYGTLEENKKVSRSLWSEEEEDELRTLFMEHQTNKYPQDLVDWLLDNLINKNRTRRGVMKKLKEMMLIVGSKSVRNEVSKRLPKEWSEEEVNQLSTLWEAYKDESDPVDAIYHELRIKRPKPKIKDKLLELGLAKDRKELRKKRIKKSNAEKSTWESGSNSEEDSDRSNSVPSIHQKPKKDVKKKRKQPKIVYTDAHLSGLLKDVIDKGMTEALKWVKESLEDCLEDEDEENEEGVPLVTVTDEASKAVESHNFQRLLRAFGFEEPAADESYWRIPSNMLKVTMRKRCDLINAALSGQFIEADPLSRTLDNDSSTDEDIDALVTKRFDRRTVESAIESVAEPSISGVAKSSGNSTTVSKNIVKPTKKRPKASVQSSDSESEKEKEQVPTKTIVNNDSSTDEDIDALVNKRKIDYRTVESTVESAITISEMVKSTDDSTTVSTNIEMSKKKRIKVAVHSSDSESENKTEQDKRQLSENSDTETQPTKKRRFIDSDGEEGEESRKEEETELKTKQPRGLISDDED